MPQDTPHPQRRPARPQGQPTRGKTARNRLRRVDTFVLLYDAGLIQRQDGPFAGAWVVDLGYGAEPITTLEFAQRLRQVHTRLPVLGVEIDPERVANALPHADVLTNFRLGGFNLPLQTGETVRLIRAFNVLRQYDEAEVTGAWRLLGQALLPGGLLIEGTSDPFGRVLVANLLRRTPDALTYEGLLFSTNFHSGFAPEQFQPVLPKNCIHRMLPGEPIHALITDWVRAAQETIGHREWGYRQWFEASATTLARRGHKVLLRRRLLRRGYLLWQNSPGEEKFPL